LTERATQKLGRKKKSRKPAMPTMKSSELSSSRGRWAITASLSIQVISRRKISSRMRTGRILRRLM
jgi:hypothetical protein